MPREFKSAEAIRQNVPLLLGLCAPSGGGKTWSALLLALGIQQECGGDIYVVDSDNNRALHYAGMKTGVGTTINFKHVPFRAPHDSIAYRDVLRYCEAQKAGVIVVDTLSKEHDGEGGLLETHETELDRLTKGQDGRRESMSMLAWAKPKAARRKLIQQIQELNTHSLFTFRARQGVKPVKVNGKTEIVPQGFTPIAGEELTFEMTLNALLLPHSGGVATWESEYVGERMMIKLPEQFAALRSRTTPIDEALGRNLAKWSKGGAPRAATPKAQEPDEERSQSDPAASKPAAQSPAGKPATPASEPSTGTDSGSQAITGDTGRGESDGPTSQQLESSLTPTADLMETQSGGTGLDDSFPGDRKPAEPPEQPGDQSVAQAQEGRPEPAQAAPLAGFADFAAAVAEARDWPSINQALSDLSKTEAFKGAEIEMRNKTRYVAFSRLKELNDGGYSFDFINDAQSYRCSLEFYTDRDALKGNRDAFQRESNPVWRALPTNAKIALDKAYADRDILLAHEQKQASEFA